MSQINPGSPPCSQSQLPIPAKSYCLSCHGEARQLNETNPYAVDAATKGTIPTTVAGGIFGQRWFEKDGVSKKWPTRQPGNCGRNGGIRRYLNDSIRKS